MNQSDLIQRIIGAEHQAQAMTQDAKAQQENLEVSIAEELQVLEAE